MKYLEISLSVVLFTLVNISHDCYAAGRLIPQAKIDELRSALPKNDKRGSSVRIRRACKNVVRDGEKLLGRYGQAANRFLVLGVMLQSQKILIPLEATDRNRKTLFDICTRLAAAPDKYAKIRLDADLLLYEQAQVLAKADVKARAAALAALVQRYRDTPGEAKALMVGAMIAPGLNAHDLNKEFIRQMDMRFSDDPEVIAFRRQSLGVSNLDVRFRGRFTCTDGVEICFPDDRLGRRYLIIFWSEKTANYEMKLSMMKEKLDENPGRFEVFSFNLDELQDAGAAKLKALGLDWTAMHLPGGRNSETFKVYGLSDPVSVLVNEYAHALLAPPGSGFKHGQKVEMGVSFELPKVIQSETRYSTQLQSLLIGDVLLGLDVGTTTIAGHAPAEKLQAIQDCFTLGPLRYRKTIGEALADYTRAEKLCQALMASHSEARDLWKVRNRRIIALIGMWRLSGEAKHLALAAEQARAALDAAWPAGGDVVPRFCLALQALREGVEEHSKILADMIAAGGGDNAPANIHAAAAIFALAANSRELHERHRSALLEKAADQEHLWPLIAFMKDRYHRYYLLKATHPAPARMHRTNERWNMISHGVNKMRDPLPAIEFKTLDGQLYKLPRESQKKLTLLLFIEPSPDSTELPIEIQGKPAEKKKRALPGMVQYALDLAERHIHDEVEVVTAFISDDTAHIKALMQAKQWPCKAVLVPGALNSPILRQLGVLSADRHANVFLIRRDGTIAWNNTGLDYRAEYSFTFPCMLAMKVHIEVCDTELAYKALAAGDYKRAVKIFSGPFLPEKDERYRWAGPRFHGRALAHMALKQWGAALADIDVALADHEKRFNHDARYPCQSVLEMQSVKALILKKLGRDAEASATEILASGKPGEYPVSIYETFHSRLRELKIHELSEKSE